MNKHSIIHKGAIPSDPKAAAAAMIAKMTLNEKISLLHGGKIPGQAGYE